MASRAPGKIGYNKWFWFSATWDWTRFLVGGEWSYITYTSLRLKPDWDLHIYLGPLRVEIGSPLEND